MIESIISIALLIMIFLMITNLIVNTVLEVKLHKAMMKQVDYKERLIEEINRVNNK